MVFKYIFALNKFLQTRLVIGFKMETNVNQIQSQLVGKVFVDRLKTFKDA